MKTIERFVQPRAEDAEYADLARGGGSHRPLQHQFGHDRRHVAEEPVALLFGPSAHHVEAILQLRQHPGDFLGGAAGRHLW